MPLYEKHGVDCIHVFRAEVVRASEFERSIRDDDDYSYDPAPWSRA